jgi:hypothetical protein
MSTPARAGCCRRPRQAGPLFRGHRGHERWAILVSPGNRLCRSKLPITRLNAVHKPASRRNFRKHQLLCATMEM